MSDNRNLTLAWLVGFIVICWIMVQGGSDSGSLAHDSVKPLVSSIPEKPATPAPKPSAEKGSVEYCQNQQVESYLNCLYNNSEAREKELREYHVPTSEELGDPTTAPPVSTKIRDPVKDVADWRARIAMMEELNVGTPQSRANLSCLVDIMARHVGKPDNDADVDEIMKCSSTSLLRQERVQKGASSVPSFPSPAAEKPPQPEGIPPDIQKFLERWQTSVLGHDLEAQMDCYAPVVDVFFRKWNVSQDQIRKDKEAVFNEYPDIRVYTISESTVESVSTEKAVVTFRKEWDARGARQFAGAERQRLTLRKLNGDWKIVGEQELQIFWVRKNGLLPK